MPRLCHNNHLVHDPTAVFCPACGERLPPTAQQADTVLAKVAEDRKRRRRNALFIVGGVILVVLYMCPRVADNSGASSARTAPPTLSASQIRERAVAIPYESLARDTETYVGRYVRYEGKVIQVLEHSRDRYTLRVYVTKGSYEWDWDDAIYVTYTGSRLLEDDIITLYGKVKGRKTYTAVLGNQITIPEIEALLVEH